MSRQIERLTQPSRAIAQWGVSFDGRRARSAARRDAAGSRSGTAARPRAHNGSPTGTGNGPPKTSRCQAVDAGGDLRVELRRSGWIVFVDEGDRLDDIGDRFFGVGDLQRPR